jgi:hypothetical protein
MTAPYRVIDQPIGLDVVALTRFGGEMDDPVAAGSESHAMGVAQPSLPAGRYSNRTAHRMLPYAMGAVQPPHPILTLWNPDRPSRKERCMRTP